MYWSEEGGGDGGGAGDGVGVGIIHNKNLREMERAEKGVYGCW